MRMQQVVQGMPGGGGPPGMGQGMGGMGPMQPAAAPMMANGPMRGVRSAAPVRPPMGAPGRGLGVGARGRGRGYGGPHH